MRGLQILKHTDMFSIICFDHTMVQYPPVRVVCVHVHVSGNLSACGCFARVCSPLPLLFSVCLFIVCISLRVGQGGGVVYASAENIELAAKWALMIVPPLLLWLACVPGLFVCCACMCRVSFLVVLCRCGLICLACVRCPSLAARTYALP